MVIALKTTHIATAAYRTIGRARSNVCHRELQQPCMSTGNKPMESVSSNVSKSQVSHFLSQFQIQPSQWSVIAQMCRCIAAEDCKLRGSGLVKLYTADVTSLQLSGHEDGCIALQTTKLCHYLAQG